MRIPMFTWPLFWRFMTQSRWMGSWQMSFGWDYSLFLWGTRHRVGFNLYNWAVLVLGRSYHRSSLPSSFRLRGLLSWGARLHNSDSKILSLSIRHWRDSRILFEDAHNMVIRIGSKFNSFRFSWMVKQVDATGSGTLFSKTAEEAHRLLKEMLANNYY